MSGRVDPFANPGPEEKLDLKNFKPLKRPERVNPSEIRKVAEQASFPSREPVADQKQSARPEARQRRAARNVQLNCKVSQQVLEDIYALNDELQRRMEMDYPGVTWTLGMTQERMAKALRRELDEEQP